MTGPNMGKSPQTSTLSPQSSALRRPVLALSLSTVTARSCILRSSAGTFLAASTTMFHSVHRKSSRSSFVLPTGSSLSISPAVASADRSVGVGPLTAASRTL